jgi:hypothetical protein
LRLRRTKRPDSTAFDSIEGNGGADNSGPGKELQMSRAGMVLSARTICPENQSGEK